MRTITDYTILTIGGGYKHLLTLSLILLSLTTWAQNPRAKGAESDSLSMRERWGFKTNAVDWLLTIPNVGVEFDLGQTSRSKRTVNANLKWNWNTSHKYKPSTVFNLFDFRVEWRQYFRTRQQNVPITLKKDGFKKYIKEHIFSTKRNHPRDSRAYYWGVYANAASYNIKFGKEGRQGNAFGAGISLGYTMPLYGYGSESSGRHFIDLEMGGALGLLFTNYDVYEFDDESDCYPIIEDKCKGGHLVPLPLVTDLRVAFVYRFKSVKDKYKQSVERRFDKRQQILQKEKERTDSIKQRLDEIQSKLKRRKIALNDSVINQIAADSSFSKEVVRIWRTMLSEQRAADAKAADEKLRKHIADSLGIVLKDTLAPKDERLLRRAFNEYKENQERQAKQKVDEAKGKKPSKKDKKQGDKEKSVATEAAAEPTEPGGEGAASPTEKSDKKNKASKEKKQKEQKPKEKKEKGSRKKSDEPQKAEDGV